MKNEHNTIVTSNTERAIIERLMKVSSVEGRNVTNAGRIVALYIAGMSEKRVKDHIKCKTFSGANALEHISCPDTPQARGAWIRGKAICHAAGLRTIRFRWEDKASEDLLINVFDEEGLEAIDTEDISNTHEIQHAHSGSRLSQTVGIKEGRATEDKTTAHKRLVSVVRALAAEKRSDLERLKKEHGGLARPDFIWHYLLQSFSTMGRAAGWHGLIGNKNNYQRVTYNVLAALSPTDREAQTRRICHEAGIRMPDKKADYILGCFDYVKQLGGLEAAKAKLLAQPGREAKIRFLQTFPGIGPKYARNIMMDVYHDDFRNSIALDVRIKAISDSLGLSFSSYAEHESFYLDIARDSGINGWELDRLLFNFRKEVESRLGVRISA